MLGISVTLVSGCAIIEGPTPSTPERQAPVVPETPPALVPDGSAADNLPFFSEVMRGYAAGDGPVQGAPLVDAVTAAGFDRAAMQVSFDQTQTGLAADNIFVSVRLGAECLMGQLVAEDRSFVVVVAPVLGPNQDICIIGNTRPIDW